MINYAKLTPTLWSIAGAEGVVVGNVAWPMLEECIHKGAPIYKGAEGPEGMEPDYKELKKRMESEDVSDERRFFIAAFQNQYGTLCRQNSEGKYVDMIVTVGGEMAKLAATQSPEALERYKRLKKELDDLAQKWKEEHKQP